MGQFMEAMQPQTIGGTAWEGQKLPGASFAEGLSDLSEKARKAKLGRNTVVVGALTIALAAGPNVEVDDHDGGVQVGFGTPAEAQCPSWLPPDCQGGNAGGGGGRSQQRAESAESNDTYSTPRSSGRNFTPTKESHWGGGWSWLKRITGNRLDPDDGVHRSMRNYDTDGGGGVSGGSIEGNSKQSGGGDCYRQFADGSCLPPPSWSQ